MSDLATGPIDLAHLARYTGGERELNCEVFRMFADHCAQSLSTLKARLDAGDGKGWHETAHGLKGAALGIGAFAVAEGAGAAESVDLQEDPHRAANALAALSGRSEVVLAYIEAYLAAG